MRIRKKEICDDCGKLSTVQKRKDNGLGVCGACYKKTYQNKERCFKCEKERSVSKRINNQPVCEGCNKKYYYEYPKEQCSICNALDIVRQRIDGYAICPKCYKYPKQECFECKKINRVFKWNDNKPFCQNCYKSPLKYCEKCGNLKPVYKKNQDGYSVCDSCYIVPKHICSVCDKEKPINSWNDGWPVCHSCYEAPKRICSDCGRLQKITSNSENKSLCQACNKRLRSTNEMDYYIKCLLRSRLLEAFERFSISGKIKSSCEYGIDYEAIIKHLGPRPGKRGEYHIDHIKPLCLFNFNDLEQIKLAFAPENHQWLTKEENMKKGFKYIEKEKNGRK